MPSVDEAANTGKKLAFVAVETVAIFVALVAVVAVVALVADVAEVQLVAVVAVEAFPVKAPTKVVVVNVFVEGLKVNPVPNFGTWLPFAEAATINGKNEAFVEDETVPTLVAFVAVVAVVADVAVEAFPVKAPTKVVVDNVFVEGLKVNPVPKFGT